MAATAIGVIYLTRILIGLFYGYNTGRVRKQCYGVAYLCNETVIEKTISSTITINNYTYCLCAATTAAPSTKPYRSPDRLVQKEKTGLS